MDACGGRLVNDLGCRFVLGVAGCRLGVGAYWAFVPFASQYLYTDQVPEGLGLTASQVAAVNALLVSPWVVKALYGIVSDSVPLCGRRRTPYLLIATSVGMVSYGILMLPFQQPATLCAGLLAVHFSAALGDVMLDAILAEKTQAHPHLATDLQSFILGFSAVVKIITSTFKGVLVRVAGMSSLFSICIGCLVVAFPSCGLLNERQMPVNEAQCMLGAACTNFTHSGAPIFRLAQCISAFGVMLATGTFLIDNVPWGPPLAALVACAVVPWTCWHFERVVSPTLAKASIYTFLSAAMQPHLIVLFKWYKETPENCNPVKHIPGLHPLPCFGTDFVGYLDLFAEVAFLLALLLYNLFFARWHYRSIFAALQLALVLVNLIDLFWVSRLNLAMGIDDHLFAFGAELLQATKSAPHIISGPDNTRVTIETCLVIFNHAPVQNLTHSRLVRQ